MDLLNLDLPGIRKIASGKVREIFDLGEHLLLVATDRISAFDCILPNAIPRKGAVLNSLSAFWFNQFYFVDNHIVATEFKDFPAVLKPFADQLSQRSMVVRKAKPLPVECVVRGYLAGSGWKDYQATQSISGVKLPSGLQQAQRLPETLFTPSTKATSGHDETISWEECVQLLGDDVATEVCALSIRIYEAGRAYAAERGIIVADTKFEFGLLDGRVILIDECLTPDSSRFWPADQHRLGISPPSYDKQFVRDHLLALNWNQQPPAPNLPAEVIARTQEKYLAALKNLLGS